MTYNLINLIGSDEYLQGTVTESSQDKSSILDKQILEKPDVTKDSAKLKFWCF